jgi:hypothetical protein
LLVNIGKIVSGIISFIIKIVEKKNMKTLVNAFHTS